MRTSELASEHGLSTQAVRNYTDEGILPAAPRSDAGYRIYDERHAIALRAFLALAAGLGRPSAREILRCTHAGDTAGALTRLDRAHAGLAAERDTVDAVEDALRRITGALPAPPAPGRTGDGDTPISALAHRLRLRPATLRRWERAGLLAPVRDPRTGHRRYGPDDVRDAHLVHQLRRGGLGLAAIAPVLADLRDAGDPAAAVAALGARRDLLVRRSRSALTGAAGLDALLPPAAARA
ncbi:MerR family transcriptional regulator [Pseudonocardia sp. HH130630-07]|uniref:MerR family transcriptional regulator n=1 Tax=Pseudonocardia sp. HH130630-07 TaxID=1690815 RepID=UPI000814BAEA|nr:MerR family transcriptional regulator [Pseudonocardia sp. HH130630-07]ANY08603.1 hypothetical protein AFB00_22680 [Pseudonocardia sp. HH130630-07]